MRRMAMACGLATLLAGCGSPAPDTVPDEEPPRTLTTLGVVSDGGMDDDRIWFELSRIDQRFVLDTAATPKAKALYAALEDSNKTGRSVSVHFDIDSGVFDDDSDKPSFVVRSIDYGGRKLAGMKGPRQDGRRGTADEAALARGLAIYNGGQSAEAVAALDLPLSGVKLRAPLKALALKTRGSALEEAVVVQRQRPTAEDDRQLLRALADFEAWARLEPDNAEARYSIAEALRYLGGYDEALEVYRVIAAEWPDESLWSAIRIGATYRIIGDYPRALAALDDLVARDGAQSGMPFHYHRAWTLTHLGRYSQAVAEVSEGLWAQPDYEWAYFRRACAFARLAKPVPALADQRRGVELLESRPQDSPPSPAAKHNAARARAVMAELQAAVDARSMTPTAAPCDGYWEYGDAKRDRSPLLDEAAARQALDAARFNEAA